MTQKKDETLQDYKKFQGQLNRQDFINRFDHPFLVFDREPGDKETDKQGFTTKRLNPSQMTGLMKKALMKTISSKTVKIVKAGSNIFQGSVNIGRVSNCDVVIDSPVISKLHAFFTKNLKSRTYNITDANSTNGTYVNDVKLGPNEKRLLNDGDIISFGRQLNVSFYTPEGCYDLLKQVSDEKK